VAYCSAGIETERRAAVHEGSKRAIAGGLPREPRHRALAKLVGFLVTGASSLLAESIHSLADTGNQGLLVLGGPRAARTATPSPGLRPDTSGRQRERVNPDRNPSGRACADSGRPMRPCTSA
jgi:hypothetical protein